MNIDPNNLPQLTRLELELLRDLDFVRYAISKHNERPQEPENRSATDNSGDAEADRILSETVASLPNRFTSSDVYSRTSVLNRGRIKGAIGRSVESGVFRVIERGVGRKPTTYMRQ